MRFFFFNKVSSVFWLWLHNKTNYFFFLEFPEFSARLFIMFWITHVKRGLALTLPNCTAPNYIVRLPHLISDYGVSLKYFGITRRWIWKRPQFFGGSISRYQERCSIKNLWEKFRTPVLFFCLGSSTVKCPKVKTPIWCLAKRIPGFIEKVE